MLWVDKVRLGIARWLLRSSAQRQRTSYGIRALADEVEVSLVDRTSVFNASIANALPPIDSST